MIAILFAGQGTQYPDMGQSLCQTSPAAASVYAAASQILDYDPLQLNKAQLAQTAYAQPAIVTLSLAVWQALQENWTPPADTALAGFSLGEYSALGAAGVLETGDLIMLVKERARLMQKAAEEIPGSMAAVIGLAEAKIQEILGNPLFRDKVFAVNFNAPGQIVLSGHAACLPDCLAVCSEAGARRVIPLAVNGAFHTPLMRKAGEQLARYAARLPFAPPRLALYSNTTANRLTGPIDWPTYLAHHLCNPVCWTDEIRQIAADGAAQFCELGPGKVLSGLVRKTIPGARICSTDEPDRLSSLSARLNQAEETSQQ